MTALWLQKGAILSLALVFAHAASGADLVSESRNAVELLYLRPLRLEGVVASVTTEAVPPGAEVMRTTVFVRKGPSYKPSAAILTVYLDFAAGRVAFILAKGPALSGAKTDAPRPGVVAALEKLSGLNGKGCMTLGATRRCRFEGLAEPPYVSGDASAVFNDAGVPLLFGGPLPVPESRQ